MSPEQWEALCDGCAKCCLEKLEDEDTGRIYYTNVVCRLLDQNTCRCGDYANRSKIVTNCITLTPAVLEKPNWLPSTCGYRLVDEGRDLYWWHPLVSGDPETVHAAGISVRGRVGLFEHRMGEEDLEDRIVDWPTKIPRRALRPPRNALSRSAPVKQSTQRQAAAESKRSDRPAKRRSRKT